MASADRSCPAFYTSDGGTYWSDSCSTSAGAEFSGYSQYVATVDHTTGNTTWNGSQMYTLASVETRAGEVYNGAGSAAEMVGTGEVGGARFTIWQSSMTGGFGWDGTGAQGTWMGQGILPSVEIYAESYPSTGARRVELSGEVSGLGAAFDAAALDGVALANAEAGGSCEREPSGTISIRDSLGAWYEIALSGGGGSAACDGCGTVSWRGEEVGEVCADFSPWIDWVSPW
jgi:hypothetical protein